MADATPNVKKFLDYAGLSQFWGIITNRFADKKDAIGSLNITWDADKKVQVLSGAKVGNGGQPSVVNLPNANESQAGLMSADHFAAIRDLQINIDKMAPFAGLQLDGNGTENGVNEVSLTGRKATIGLQYLTEKATDGATSKAYIALVDPSYPSTGSWVESTKDAYEAANGAEQEKFAFIKDGAAVKEYWRWNGEGVGPRNSLNEPIKNAPISKIDVTELIKTGLLMDSDVVVMAEGNAANLKAGTYIKLTFNAVNPDNGQTVPQTQYINVTDLVEIYTAGEGITITESGTAVGDDVARTGKIEVLAATDDKLGAIKTGYTEGNKTYAVKLDADKKAYVAVPWNETKVAFTTTGKDKNEKAYLVADVNPVAVKSDVDGSTTTTYNITVEVGDGIKNAEKAARTGIQSVVGDTGYVTVTKTVDTDYANEVKVTLDQTVKDSLDLADSAVQTIEAGNRTGKQDIVVNVAGADAKGQKAYTVALGSDVIASLDKADSAIQEVTVLGKKLTQAATVVTAADAKQNMELGSAAERNAADTIPAEAGENDANLKSAVMKADGSSENRYTVATTKAVKDYVDAVKSTIDTNYKGYVDTAIDALDSSLTAGVAGAATNAQGVDAQEVFTKIVIKNGKLDEDESKKALLKISDISDFRPFTTDEINAICGVDAAE